MKKLILLFVAVVFVGCGNLGESPVVYNEAEEIESPAPQESEPPEYEIISAEPEVLSEPAASSMPPQILTINPTVSESVPCVEISQQVRWSVYDFLSEYHSVFSYGIQNPDGSYSDLRGNTLETRPLVVWDWDELRGDTFYDLQGIPIDNAVYLSDFSSSGIANGFSLYDFENDGLPEIIISWEVLRTCAFAYEVYRYIDGEYVSAGYLLNTPNRFYNDGDGGLIAFYENKMVDLHGFYRISFTESGLEHEEISDTGIPLTPIPHLSDLYGEILAALRSDIRIPLHSGVYINVATDGRLRHFDDVFEMEFFMEMYFEREPFDPVIWADFTMRDFTLIQVEWSGGSDGAVYAPVNEHAVIAEVPAGSAVHITSYIETGCAVAGVGISFIDEDGTKRYFAFGRNNSEYIPRFSFPFYIVEF